MTDDREPFIEKLNPYERRLANYYLEVFGVAYIDHNLKDDSYKLIDSVDVIQIKKNDDYDD